MSADNPIFLIQAKSNIENASKQVMNLIPKDQPIHISFPAQASVDYYNGGLGSINDAASKREVRNTFAASVISHFLFPILGDYVSADLYNNLSKTNNQQVSEEMLMLNKQFMKRLAEDVNGMSAEALKKFTDKRCAAVHVYGVIAYELEQLGVKAPESVRIMYMQTLLSRIAELFNVINGAVELNKDNIATCIRQIAATKEQTGNIQKTVDLLGNQLENTKKYLENALLGVKVEQKEMLENHEVLKQQVATVQDWLQGEQKARREQALLNNTQTILQLFNQLGQVTGSKALTRTTVAGMCSLQAYKHFSDLQAACAVGKKVNTVVEKVSKFAEAAASVTAIATPVLGIAMATVSVIGLFTSGENDANAIIFKQLECMLKEMHGMRYQVHLLDKRLGHIEEGLGKLYETICFGFDAVLRKIISEQNTTRVFLKESFEQIKNDLSRLHKELAAVALNDMKQLLFRIKNEQVGSHFFRDMNEVGYRDFLRPMEYWMIERGREQVSNGGHYANMGASEVLAFVGDPTEFRYRNVFLGNFLGYLEHHAWRLGFQFGEANLVNAWIWMENADQYIKLISNVINVHPEWPNSALLSNVIQSGEAVLNFIDKIRNRKDLFAQLFADYEKNLRAVKKEFDSAIQEAKDSWNIKNERAPVGIFDDLGDLQSKVKHYDNVAPLDYTDKTTGGTFKYSNIDKKFTSEISAIILAERLGALNISISIARPNTRAKGATHQLSMSCNGVQLKKQAFLPSKNMHYDHPIPHLNLNVENAKALSAIQQVQSEKRKGIAVKLLNDVAQPGIGFAAKLKALEDSYLMLKAFLTLIGIDMLAHEGALLNRSNIVNMLTRVLEDATELCNLDYIINNRLEVLDVTKNEIIKNLNNPLNIERVSLETQLRFLVENLKSLDNYFKLSKKDKEALEAAQRNTQNPVQVLNSNARKADVVEEQVKVEKDNKIEDEKQNVEAAHLKRQSQAQERSEKTIVLFAFGAFKDTLRALAKFDKNKRFKFSIHYIPNGPKNDVIIKLISEEKDMSLTSEKINEYLTELKNQFKVVLKQYNIGDVTSNVANRILTIKNVDPKDLPDIQQLLEEHGQSQEKYALKENKIVDCTIQ